MTDQKTIAAAPRVTAVVVSSGKFEATIRSDRGIEIVKVGPQGGRNSVLVLNAAEAESLLTLVAHGRQVIEGMST